MGTDKAGSWAELQKSEISSSGTRLRSQREAEPRLVSHPKSSPLAPTSTGLSPKIDSLRNSTESHVSTAASYRLFQLYRSGESRNHKYSDLLINLWHNRCNHQTELYLFFLPKCLRSSMSFAMHRANTMLMYNYPTIHPTQSMPTLLTYLTGLSPYAGRIANGDWKSSV